MKRHLTAAAVSACALLALSSTDARAASGVLGTGHGINVGTVPLTTTLSGAQYLLKDPTRGNTETVDARTGQVMTDADNIWGDATAADRQSVGVDAQFGAAVFWDYFKDNFGRSGILGDGRGAKSVVHYGSNYTNAFWDDSCFCISYGDGAGNAHPVISLDVTGHEFTHGITSATAGLNFSGEAGGLNEATSDVFGTMVEWYANVPADTPDYMIGEKIDPSGPPVRRMDHPSLDGVSPDCWSSSVGNLDAHYASGVGDHFFYLLAEGSGAKVINGVSYNSPTCDGSTVTGIGRDKAAAIWYRVLTAYLVPTSDYGDTRTAMLNAASDLYGAGGAEYNAVAAAWSAVDVS